MPDSDYGVVSWREFSQFLDTYNQLARRVEAMDQSGTRGVAVIQVQVTGLTRQVTDLEGEVRAWQAAHNAAHDVDNVRRIAARRWAVGTAIAGLTLLVALIAMVGELLTHAHA